MSKEYQANKNDIFDEISKLDINSIPLEYREKILNGMTENLDRMIILLSLDILKLLRSKRTEEIKKVEAKKPEPLSIEHIIDLVNRKETEKIKDIFEDELLKNYKVIKGFFESFEKEIGENPNDAVLTILKTLLEVLDDDNNKAKLKTDGKREDFILECQNKIKTHLEKIAPMPVSNKEKAPEPASLSVENIIDLVNRKETEKIKEMFEDVLINNYENIGEFLNSIKEKIKKIPEDALLKILDLLFNRLEDAKQKCKFPIIKERENFIDKYEQDINEIKEVLKYDWINKGKEELKQLQYKTSESNPENKLENKNTPISLEYSDNIIYEIQVGNSILRICCIKYEYKGQKKQQWILFDPDPKYNFSITDIFDPKKEMQNNERVYLKLDEQSITVGRRDEVNFGFTKLKDQHVSRDHFSIEFENDSNTEDNNLIIKNLSSSKTICKLLEEDARKLMQKEYDWINKPTKELKFSASEVFCDYTRFFEYSKNIIYEIKVGNNILRICCIEYKDQGKTKKQWVLFDPDQKYNFSATDIFDPKKEMQNNERVYLNLSKELFEKGLKKELIFRRSENNNFNFIKLKNGKGSINHFTIKITNNTLNGNDDITIKNNSLIDSFTKLSKQEANLDTSDKSKNLLIHDEKKPFTEANLSKPHLIKYDENKNPEIPKQETNLKKVQKQEAQIMFTEEDRKLMEQKYNWIHYDVKNLKKDMKEYKRYEGIPIELGGENVIFSIKLNDIEFRIARIDKTPFGNYQWILFDHTLFTIEDVLNNNQFNLNDRKFLILSESEVILSKNDSNGFKNKVTNGLCKIKIAASNIRFIIDSKVPHTKYMMFSKKEGIEEKKPQSPSSAYKEHQKNTSNEQPKFEYGKKYIIDTLYPKDLKEDDYVTIKTEFNNKEEYFKFKVINITDNCAKLSCEKERIKDSFFGKKSKIINATSEIKLYLMTNYNMTIKIKDDKNKIEKETHKIISICVTREAPK